MKNIHIIGGGTVQHVRNHLALSAPSYGTTARDLYCMIQANFARKRDFSMNTEITLTRMADGGSSIETNQDVEKWIDEIKADLNTKIVFFNVALCDMIPSAIRPTENETDIGKYAARLETRSAVKFTVDMVPAPKLVPKIRDGRKDIFLVAFKATCNASRQEMYEKGLRLCKEGSCNLVLVNDTVTRLNMIVTPEEAAYHETTNRKLALENLIDMTLLRSHLTFTQSTVVEGKLVPWNSDEVPTSLRTVVDYCIQKNAYKPFNGATVGHFATKLSDTEFLTSIRRSNFNDLSTNGLVRIKTDGPDTVIAYGAKPSVGGQSQRIVFFDHPGMDCIVHFHCPLKTNYVDDIPIRTQREYECGSHECGKNTSDGLKAFGSLKAVMLENHGPNIVFNKAIDPQEVIDFIERNFELTEKTGGYNLK